MNSSKIFAGAAALSAWVLSGLIGCTESDATLPATEEAAPITTAVAPAKAASPSQRIAWFEGSVDEAFLEATRSGKPVFLYWGAEWCPPCHLVKSTVFKSRSFIERSRLFIPVYLDGDTANAQAVGERFSVLGYPTMILFRPDGEEITRIPGSSDVSAYANALDVSLNSETAVVTLLEDLMSNPRALSANECGQLAFHSWGQDQRALVDRDEVAVYRTIYERCPAQASRARAVAWMTYVGTAAAVQSDEIPFDISSEQRPQAIATMTALLADKAAVRANLYGVLFDGAPIVAQLTSKDSDARATLTQAFLAAYDDIAADDEVFMTERLYTRTGRLAFERIDDPQRAPSAALREDILTSIAAADAAIDNVYTRQSVMNTANNVLVDAGFLDESRKLLIREIGISRQPYYFMTALADVEQQQGNVNDALGWLKRAWEVCEGPATRFQWGNYYVAGLIEMVPEQTTLIRDTVVQVFDELAQTNAFYQRPKRQLERLERRLSEWSENADTTEAMTQIRARVSEVCAALPDDDEAKATCQSFLTS